MNQGEVPQGEGTKILEESELQAELTAIIGQNLLPSRIAQKIGEKIKENKIKITKGQLYKLVEKIQTALQGYTTSNHTQIPIKREATPTTENRYSTQNTDMKKLVEEIENLNKRMKILEENELEDMKGSTGRLVRTKDIRTIEPQEILGESMQPLEQIPNDPESIVLIMKWLQYLVDRTGKNNLPDILGYYVDISWISDNVRLDLIGYSKGLIEETPPNVQRQSHLPTRDHLQSLLFIQRLKGVQLDERFISKIERDMEKMAKSLEGYQINKQQ